MFSNSKKGRKFPAIPPPTEISWENGIFSGIFQWAMAILYFAGDDYSRAERNFHLVLRQNPSSPSVLNQIGACLHNLHRFDEALSLQNQALASLPGFPRAVYNQALTLHVKGDTRYEDPVAHLGGGRGPWPPRKIEGEVRKSQYSPLW